MSFVCRTILAGAAFAMLAGPLTANERAGRVKKMQPDAFQAITSIGQALSGGDEIIRNATVYTRQYGTIEILLDDDTDLMLGPNARVTIDDYVFAGTSGSLAVTLAKGAIRVISGRMPKENVRLNSTIAFVGIRGTQLWLDRDTPDLLKIWTDEGVVTAQPLQSDEVFTFVAPIYAECTVLTCEIVPAPPPPVKYPLDPRVR